MTMMPGLEPANLWDVPIRQIVDLSPTIENGMHGWHTHPAPRVDAEARTFARDGYFCQGLSIPEHAGSHVDAPAHVLQAAGTPTVERLALDRFLGRGVKIDLRSLSLQAGEALTLPDLERLRSEQGVSVRHGDIVIFDFGWDQYSFDEFPGRGPDYWGRNQPGLSEDVCAWLADAGVKGVGADNSALDTQLIDGETVAEETGHHKYFLPNGILIYEGLTNLAALPGEFFFIAFPLRIRGGSGSPVRAVGVF